MPDSSPPTSGPSGLLRDATLERLPDALYAAVVTGPRHDLEARIAGVMLLRAALIEGRTLTPDLLPWPTPLLAHQLLAWLAKVPRPSECQGSPERVDTILNMVIDAANTSTLDALMSMTSEQVHSEVNVNRSDSLNTPDEAEIAAVSDYLVDVLLQPRHRERMGGVYGEPISDSAAEDIIRKYVAVALPEWYRSVALRSGTTALLEYLESREIPQLYNFKVEHCVRAILEAAFASRSRWQRAVLDGTALPFGSSPPRPPT